MSFRPKVGFIDDESHILRGISRSLEDMDDVWDMEFFSSGEDFLAAMDQTPFDIVVSDMRMPGLDGAQVLERVRQRAPQTIRIILSGYADTESVLRTVGPAHMYLAKPCDVGRLKDAITRQLDLRRLMDDPSLRTVLAGLSSLPSLPRTFLELQADLQSPQCSAQSVAAIIGRDMAMTAEILRLTNSAYFSTGQGVTSALHAVRLMGIETVQALVLRVGVFRQFAGKSEIEPVLEDLSTRSLALSRLAQAIAEECGADSATCKVAGIAALLSDIGCLVLLDTWPERYGRVLRQARDGQPLYRLERQEFGLHHALIGGYLLGVWGFSDQIVSAVAYGCEPSACPHPDDSLTAVHAARALGPVSPLLGAVCDSEGGADCGLDMKYLIEMSRDGHVRRWRDMVRSAEDGK